MLPQEESLNILVEFLLTSNKRYLQGIDIATLRELARIVLEENVFVYGKKYYQQIIGGALGSPFTLTLANIFMWKWEQESICKELPLREIYGRYVVYKDLLQIINISLLNRHIDDPGRRFR